MNAIDFTLQGLGAMFQAVLAASWQGSIAIVLVLLVRRALGFRAAARWHYLLWGLAIIRLLVPAFVLPHNPASLENIPVLAPPFASAPRAEIQQDAASGIQPPKNEEADVRPVRAAHVRSAAPQFPRKRLAWAQWAALAWLVGATTLGAWFVSCALRVHRRLRRDSSPVEARVEALWTAACRRWLRGQTPSIRAADWIASPALFGVVRPTLLVPRQSLTAFSAEDWEHVFAHEIAHLRSRDHWSQLLVMLTLCAHWFNPIVWIGLRRLRVDRELAADEWALQRLEGERALAYGETLFKTLLARPGNLFHPGMVGISEDGAQMKQRLRRITARLPRRIYGSLAGLAALLALSVVLLGQSAPPATTPKQPEDKPATSTATSVPSLSLPVTPWPSRPITIPNGPPSQASDPRIHAEILAAARAGDFGQINAILTQLGSSVAPNSQHEAMEVLQELLKKRELAAYTVLLDQILKFPLGKSWRLSDPDLAALVKEDRTDFLEMLLARRLELDRLSEAAKSASPWMAEWITRRVAEVGKQRADIEALGKAAAEGDLPTLQKLVEAHADVNGVGKDNNTPLIRAVFKDRLDSAQFLLEHGAEVDKPRFPGWDYTPLCLAHSVPMAELLKKAGANVQAKLFQRDVSILTYVAMWGPSDLVAWFIKQGLDPKMLGDNRRTLLFDLGDASTAKLLLEAGVDPNQVDDSGQTAIATARNGAVAQALIDGGAKLRDLPEPLLPRMVYSSSESAIETVLKAGADQDPVTLQETLNRLERRNPNDFPDWQKLRKLLQARGARSMEPWDPVAYYRGNVSMEDHTFINNRSILVRCYAAYGFPSATGSSEGQLFVDSEGNFGTHVREGTKTLTLAVYKEGYAAIYAGPFSPPYKEKLEGIRMVLRKGYSAAVQIVDEFGKPIAGAKVQGYYPGPPETNLPVTQTDAAGTALLEHMGDTPVNVRVSAEGYEENEIVALHPDPAKPYRWALKKAQPFWGVVVSAATGDPIVGASIKLAGVRGPHKESHDFPPKAPLLATTDGQGKFTLSSLRSDSVYFLFVEAPQYGGILLRDIETVRYEKGLRGDYEAPHSEMKIPLGPELTVRGKLVNIPAGLMHRGAVALSYAQYFPIGSQSMATDSQVQVKPVHGEAEFTIGPLYAYPVSIRVGDKEVKLDTKDLPKSDVVIDFAQ